MIPIGKRLMLSPAFPPVHTVHATFTAHGVPSSLRPTGAHHSAFHYRRHRRCEHRFSVFTRPLICFVGLCSLDLEERIHRVEHHLSPIGVHLRGFTLQLSKNTEHVSLFRHIYPFIPPLGACSGPGRFRQTSSEGTFLSSIRTYPYRPIRISTGSNSGAFTSQVRQPLGILTMGGLWTPDISSTTENGLSGMFPCLRSTSADFNELHTLPCMS